MNVRPDDASLSRWIRAWCGFSAVCLIVSTYRLWFPTEDIEFPIVPLLSAGCGWPLVTDWLMTACLLVAWLLHACARSQTVIRIAAAVIVTAAVGLVILNQHRLQPWHYQLTLFAFFLCVSDPRKRIERLQWLAISIYFFSAVSKFDFEFVHTVGQQFISVIMGGGELLAEPSTERVLIALSIPALELLLALGLVYKPSRKYAGVGVMVMHGLLLYVLGPLGLGHSNGVLLWNVHFLVLAPLLFVLPTASMSKRGVEGKVFDHEGVHSAGPAESGESRQRSLSTASGPIRTDRFAFAFNAVLWTSIALPIAERFEWWDHWPSWAVYAPHSSRVVVEVALMESESLPESLKAALVDSDANGIWARVPLGSWSLQELGVPVYPQARFQAGVARALVEKVNSPFAIRATILSTAARTNGRRRETRLEGRRELARINDLFVLNTQPR